MDSPICRYCQQTYSRINESIYIVCLCEEKIKYAHGSCFRNWIRFHDFGVCDVCLTKTKIVPDGRKSFKETKFPPAETKLKLSIFFSILWLLILLGYLLWLLKTGCWETYCFVILIIVFVVLIISLLTCCVVKESRKYFQNLVNSNRYWKIVYCKEEKDGKKRIKMKYTNVPLSAPWETVHTSIYNDHDDIDYVSSIPYKYEFAVNDFSGIADDNITYEHRKDINNGIPLPNAWEPKDYPYVKKNPVYNKDTANSSKVRADSTYQVLDNSNNSYSNQSYTGAGSNWSSVENTRGEQNRSSANSYISHTRGGQDQSSASSYISYTRGEQDMSSQKSNNSYGNNPYISGHSKRSSVNSNTPSTNLRQSRSRKSSADSIRSYTSKRQSQIQKESQGYHQLSYIDSRADSFYKNSEHVDLQKYRQLLQKRQAKSQTDLKHLQSMSPKPAHANVFRASSEPDLKKSRNDTYYKRFSELFRHDNQHSKRRGPKQDGNSPGRFRLKNVSDTRPPSVMPKDTDVVYKSSDDIFSYGNVKSSKYIPRSRSDVIIKPAVEDKFPVQRSRSMYLPEPQRPGKESPKTFENSFNFITPGSTHATPEPKKRPMLTQPEPTTRLENQKPAKESSKIGLTKISSKPSLVNHSEPQVRNAPRKTGIPESSKLVVNKDNSIPPRPVHRSNVSAEIHGQRNAVEPSKKELSKLNSNPKATDRSVAPVQKDNLNNNIRLQNNAPAKAPTKKAATKVNTKAPATDQVETQIQKIPRKNKKHKTEKTKEDAPDPEEIERIMKTPLNKLDMSELFTTTEPLGKKRPALLQGPNMSSLFYAPTS